MSAPVTRRTLIRAGAALAATGVVGAGAGAAAAATAEGDLAWVRFGITAEALSVAFYARARRAPGWSVAERRALERAAAAEVAHRNAFRTALTDRGEAPIDPADIEVDLPAGAFASRRTAIHLGRRIEAITLQAYLGALTTTADADLRRLFAQVAASEAQQLGWLDTLAGRALEDPFPAVHGIATAADDIAEFLP